MINVQACLYIIIVQLTHREFVQIIQPDTTVTVIYGEYKIVLIKSGDGMPFTTLRFEACLCKLSSLPVASQNPRKKNEPHDPGKL